MRQDVIARHFRSHTGNKPYKCQHCPRLFSRVGLIDWYYWLIDLIDLLVQFKIYFQKDNMDDHMRTHTGEKPYECTICPLKFSRVGLIDWFIERTIDWLICEWYGIISERHHDWSYANSHRWKTIQMSSLFYAIWSGQFDWLIELNLGNSITKTCRKSTERSTSNGSINRSLRSNHSCICVDEDWLRTLSMFCSWFCCVK